MEPIEIIVIIASSLIVISVIARAIIMRKKGKSSCGCDCTKCKKNCAHTNKNDHN